MRDLSDIGLGRQARLLRVDTIVKLRWLAIVGQSIAVIATHYLLGFPLPFGVCFLAIAASAWLNIGLRLRYPVSQRLDDRAASALLACDLIQLSGLLYLTGGLENPFAMLFLAPIMISAVSLSGRWTLVLAVLMVVAATLLAFHHLPLPWFPAAPLSLPILYVAGIWLAIVLGATFTGIYAWRVAEEARKLSDALAATELVLAREQHLTQLDGLAAAAAHELGTPLATIALVVKEISNMVAGRGPLAEDIALLGQEVQRCRTILSKLASLGDETATMLDDMTLSHLLAEVIDPQRHTEVELRLTKSPNGPEPICRRNPAILYGLGNLIENAIDFARAEVRIDADWTDDLVRIRIEDDGPGFSPDVVMRLGEPYVTSRTPQRRAKSEDGAGLGLGLFIAKTLLERSGASVTTANVEPPATGARIVITWPRSVFERGRYSPIDPAPAVGSEEAA
ncbi:MAG TPA: ActS/PrrB/RegB family redox-sensitive histidine kinase [Beijerinckiaceae bacterium]|nr:ActS/PrrB/RegB family redox-sensitive histidine kinase [Beijerinckiaceae bacterium]